MNIIKAIFNKKLFKPCFRDLDTWMAWFVVLKALFGLRMDKGELALFNLHTGRERPPNQPLKELWCIIGRRGGKSFIAALVAVFLALFHDYKQYLGPGEVGVVQIVAADRAQAQVILRYIKGILNSNSVFRQYILSELRESVELSNGIAIEVMSCSYRSIRGRTVVCSIFDEIAFWRVEGANPDKEILAATRPSMATIPNSKLIVISSPYARSGVLYETHRDYYGKDDPEILVWLAPTRVMNPTIPQKLIDRETEKDPTAARAEWYAEFREDIEEFLSLDAIVACCVLDGTLAPSRDSSYLAFTDPSGGRADAFTLAIGHGIKEKFTVDLLKAWEPPFNPESVVTDIVEALRDYRINRIVGDRYGAAWVSSAFEKHGITYEPSEKNKSDLFLGLEGLINTRSVELPADKKLINELMALERRRGKSGKDIIQHPPRGKDDLANAIAGLCHEGLSKGLHTKSFFADVLF
jgi:hypothetical protein